MLANILALAVALGSLAIYLAAFFFPEIYRKGDFIWSGVGLFYALVLWVCAERITGGVLLGQTASVALLGWFAWQTVTLRYLLTPSAQRTDVPSKEQLQEKLANSSAANQLQERVSRLFTNTKDQIQKTLGSFTKGKSKPEAESSLKPSTEATKEAKADTVEVEAKSAQTIVAKEVKVQTPLSDSQSVEPVKPNPPAPELVEASIEDAEAKHLPSQPPEVADPGTTD